MANPLKIINEIQAPDLTQENLSASLNEVFEKINDNFKKIASAPIYRGQKGESVKIKPVELMSDEHTFTDEGRKIVEAIFDDVDLTSWDDGTTSTLGGVLRVKYRTIRNVNVYDYFSKNPSILMFQLDDVEGTNLSPAQLYMFQDLRVSVVNDADGIGGFKDASCFVSFEWDSDGETYKYIKASEFPTICWSKGVGDFVWSINGQVTNIIAKGLKGLDASFTLPLFLVEDVEGNERAWNVKYVYDTSTSGWKPVENIEDMGIYTLGMGCVAYMYSGEGVDKTITGLEITTIKSVEADPVKIIYLAKMDCSIEAKPLNVMMDEIRPWLNGRVLDTNPPALYIPASAGGEEKFVHAMWRNRGAVAGADEVKHLHIGYVKLDGNGIDEEALGVKLYLHNYDEIIFPSKQVSMQLEQESMVLTAGSSFSMNRGKTSITTPKLTMEAPEFYIKNNNTAYISASPRQLQLNSASIQIPYTTSFIIKGDGSSAKFEVVGNRISLGNKTIGINNDLSTYNIINIGGKGYSKVNINSKNFEINSGGVDFKTSPTTFGGEATFEGPVIIRGQDYSEIISFYSYGEGTWTDPVPVFYRLQTGDDFSCKIGGIDLIGWKQDGTPMPWYNVGEPTYEQGNGPGWRNFAGRCIRIGHMVKLYGLYKPFDGHTDSLLLLDHIPGFNVSYIKPDEKNRMGGNYVIGICQTNDANGWKSAPEVWRGAKSPCPAGNYPVDDEGGKKHGWVYLFTNEKAIMFVTPDASKTYYFEVTYFI